VNKKSKPKLNIFLIILIGAALAGAGLYVIGFFSPGGLRPLERWTDLAAYALGLAAMAAGFHVIMVASIALGGRHGGRG
jgi:Na+/proline symporter